MHPALEALARRLVPFDREREAPAACAVAYIQRRWAASTPVEPEAFEAGFVAVVPRTKATPQGGVVSPLLANIFLRFAFDNRLRETHPDVPFERYADEIVAHCRTEERAQRILESIERRLAQCRLELHPQKTKIVYGKDDDRRGSYVHEKFNFLGYTFRARRSKNRWVKHFINFSPAMSSESATKARQKMRSWRIHLRSDKAIDDLANMWNPVLRGWIQCFGRFYKSAMDPVFQHFNDLLVRWAMRKYKRLARHRQRAERWLGGIARRQPRLFAHWHLLGVKPAAG